MLVDIKPFRRFISNIKGTEKYHVLSFFPNQIAVINNFSGRVLNIEHTLNGSFPINDKMELVEVNETNIKPHVGFPKEVLNPVTNNYFILDRKNLSLFLKAKGHYLDFNFDQEKQIVSISMHKHNVAESVSYIPRVSGDIRLTENMTIRFSKDILLPIVRSVKSKLITFHFNSESNLKSVKIVDNDFPVYYLISPMRIE